MKRLVLVAGLAALALLAGCGLPGSGSSSSAPAAATPTPGCFSPGQRPAGGQFQPPAVAGTVTQAGAGTLTVHNPRTNSDVRVTYDQSVTVRSGPQTGSVSDLKTGALVAVQGQTQPDGSVHATAITIRPAGATGGGPGQGRRRPICGTPAAG